MCPPAAMAPSAHSTPGLSEVAIVPEGQPLGWAWGRSNPRTPRSHCTDSCPREQQGGRCWRQPQKTPWWHRGGIRPCQPAHYGMEIKGTGGTKPSAESGCASAASRQDPKSPLVVKCALGRGAGPPPPALISATASCRAVLVENKAEEGSPGLINY